MHKCVDLCYTDPSLVKHRLCISDDLVKLVLAV